MHGPNGPGKSNPCRPKLVHFDEHIAWKWMAWSLGRLYLPLRTLSVIHFHVSESECNSTVSLVARHRHHKALPVAFLKVSLPFAHLLFQVLVVLVIKQHNPIRLNLRCPAGLALLPFRLCSPLQAKKRSADTAPPSIQRRLEKSVDGETFFFS